MQRRVCPTISKVVVGDLTDPASLAQALARMDAPDCTSVSILGEGVWRVQVCNDSTGPITRLNVHVSAVDANGSPVNGVRRSKDVMSLDEAFSRIIGDGLPADDQGC